MRGYLEFCTRSGYGSEWGEFGLDEYLEVKGIVGYRTKAG